MPFGNSDGRWLEEESIVSIGSCFRSDGDSGIKDPSITPGADVSSMVDNGCFRTAAGIVGLLPVLLAGSVFMAFFFL